MDAIGSGWGIRTPEWRSQSPLPYHLANPEYARCIIGVSACFANFLYQIFSGWLIFSVRVALWVPIRPVLWSRRGRYSPPVGYHLFWYTLLWSYACDHLSYRDRVRWTRGGLLRYDRTSPAHASRRWTGGWYWGYPIGEPSRRVAHYLRGGHPHMSRVEGSSALCMRSQTDTPRMPVLSAQTSHESLLGIQR